MLSKLWIISSLPFFFEKGLFFLNCLFFQVFYTLESIKLVHPNYTHNDLFIRNIMIKKTKYSDDTYIRYNYKRKIFDVPVIPVVGVVDE